ncbi:MAG: hypothetical protein GC159_14565 [Phycisphaera sp.]|nr:hypothetical protein [Phycisphaera sp.]
MTRSRRTTSIALLATLAALATLVVGCDTDSFIDPSEVGRYENTPIVLPILDRLDVIEEPADEIPGLDAVHNHDLVPVVQEYVLGPGDAITVSVFELIQPGAETVQPRRIDELGNIRLPIIGQLHAAGMTARQLELKIADILDPNILRNPTVTVTIQEGRQKTFSIMGAAGTGTFTILQDNFRLLDALSLANGIPPGAQHVYVIRQVPLSDLVTKGFRPAGNDPGAGAGAAGAGAAKPDPAKDIEAIAKGEKPAAPAATSAEPAPNGATTGRFIHRDGKWVWVTASGDSPAAADIPPIDELLTQRVIDIDAQALARGEQRYNVVVRPGDIIRVPYPQTGNVFVGGSILRPGTYSLPTDGRLTLKQLVIAAGGLDPVAIPERVDLIRRVAPGQEAMVRLNLRAIFEGVQPDFYLKPDDTVNIGTNLLASFAAVIRNSFRMSYGFGFLLDRNFGNDVFGAPPRADFAN